MRMAWQGENAERYAETWVAGTDEYGHEQGY